ncbi:MAG: fluoride efflux transporter CrcB [Rhodospirillaceae bacterium]|nr:MAG: fluoride efflux transporter CrcB [Rhodospirillaceae bacterium]
MNVQLMMFVGLGGAIGAMGRFAVMSAVGHVAHTGFPWGTLTVNVIGALVLGAVLELSALMWSPSPEVRAMVVVGGLGAFTTFSTFSMDLYYLIDRGYIVNAALYAMGSVFICLVAFWAGMSLLRTILS